MTTRFTKTPIFWGLLSKVLSRPGTGSLTARPRCHPGKKPLQTSGSQWNVPGRSGMSISTCTVMNSTRITMRLRLVFWKKKIYIFAIIGSVGFRWEELCIYTYICNEILSKNCTNDSFAKINV